MHTKYVAVDDCSQRQVVKSLIEVAPTVGVAVFFVDLIQEPVHHSDVSALVVAPQQVDFVRVFDFHAE